MKKIVSLCVGALSLALLSPVATGQSMKLVAGTSCTASALTTITTPAPIAVGGFNQIVSVCVTAGAQPVCGASYPVQAQNSAAATVAMTVAQPVYSAPFTTETASPAFPAPIVINPGVGLGNSVPFAGPQGGGTGTDQKISEFVLNVPNTAIPATYSFSIVGPAVDSKNAAANGNGCNDINNATTSTALSDIPFSVVVPLGAPVITIAAATAPVTNPVSAPDDGTNITYTITATPAQVISVNLNRAITGTMSGVNAANAAGCQGIVTTSAGGTASCTVSASNVIPFDGPATATVTVGAPTVVGAYTGVGNSSSGTITNNDLPTVTVTPTTATITEGAGAGATTTVTFTLNGTTPAAFNIPITPSGTLGGRVSGTCTTATFVTVPAGSNSASCSITAVEDAIANATATVNVTAACAGTCTNVATPNEHSVITVIDNDQPIINVTCALSTLPDNGATTTCTFRNSTAIGASGFSVPFTFTADNSRHTVTGCASPIVVAANTAASSSLATCTVTAVANPFVGDGADAVTFTITAGAGYSAGLPATVAITDNDLSTISVAAAPASVTENSGTPLTYTFTSSLASIAATTVNFTLPANAARYTIANGTGIASGTCASGSVILAAAGTSFTCTVTPVNTLIVDGNVTATATITPSASYTVAAAPANAATGIITDDDVTVTVTPLSATEGSAVTFTIACTGPTGVSVTGLSFGVTPTQDVGAVAATPGMSGAVGTAGTLTCGTPFLVTVPTFNDTIIGNTRAHTLALTGSPVASNNGSVTLPVAAAVAQVLDNDVPLVVPTMSVVGLGMLALLIFGFVAFGQRRRVE